MSDRSPIEMLIEWATEVSDDLTENGHEVSALDLLDALATTGLVLVGDGMLTAPAAYAALLAIVTPGD